MIAPGLEPEPAAIKEQSSWKQTIKASGLAWSSNGLLSLGWTAIVIGLFWPFLSGQSLVGYRDSVQFYWPMFRWADEVWAAGEVPFWNPHDGLGRSHVAEGTSSLFYPGKLLFWARWCSFEARYGWYLALHVWLAGWGAGWLAGRLGADWVGRGLAILSYGLAGPVLFATTNVVYLVSAAWLPWGIGAVWRWREPAGTYAAIRGTAVFASLMILGGDPQMAGNLLLLAAGSWCWWNWNRTPEKGRWQAAGAAVAAWLVTLALIGVLAAVQILPSWQLSSESERVGFSEPRSWAEWLSASWQAGNLATFDGMWQEPTAGSHAADIYEFSQPPWTLGEWLWPGSSGRPFPEWTHWVSCLPGAGRMWQPSLYQGCVPLLLATLVLFKRELRWLVLIGGVALLGAWGWYGPVWLWNETGLATGWWNPLEGVNRAAGGVYWWLVIFVPGYAWFRYPAKLMVVVALVIATLAARGWTEVNATTSEVGCSGHRLRVRSLLVAGASALLVGIAAWVPWTRVGPIGTGDDWFGPFANDRFGWQLVLAGLHALVVSMLAWWMLSSRRNTLKAVWRRGALLGLCAAELLVANTWLLAGVNVPPLPRSTQELSVYWAEHESPPHWRERSSPERLAEVVRWEVAEAFPRLHWLWGERMLNAPATIEQQSWRDFLDWVVSGELTNSAEDVLTKEILFEDERVWVLNNPQTTAQEAAGENVVERFRAGLVASDPKVLSAPTAEPNVRLAGRVIRRTAQTVEVVVELEQAGVIFLGEAFAPGWRAIGQEVRQKREVNIPCLPVGQWLRGIWLEPGRYELRFIYSPPGVSWYMATSAMGWLIISFLMLKGTEFRLKNMIYSN